MERTTLSRKSFYVYFRDRAEAITALVTPLREEADAALEHWRGSDDPVAAGRAALGVAARTYRDHGPVLRALARASERDAEAGAVWAGFVEPLVGIAEATIALNAPALDASATARALATMNVHCLLSLDQDASNAEVDHMVETLSTIWERTILT